MTVQKPTPLSPTTQILIADRQPVSSVILLRVLCSGCDSVASGSITHHLGCDVTEGKFHFPDGESHIFPRTMSEQSDRTVSASDKNQLSFANFVTMLSCDTLSYTYTSESNTTSDCNDVCDIDTADDSVPYQMPRPLGYVHDTWHTKRFRIVSLRTRP
jgi:hypothetical protein